MVQSDDRFPGIFIDSTERKGKGVFADRSFDVGEEIYRFPVGRFLDKKEYDLLSVDEKKCVDIVDDHYELVEPPACFVNHSCNPNIREENHVAYAIRAIAAQDEITIDYDPISYIQTPFTCHCGASNCRGVVKGKKYASPPRKVLTLCFVQDGSRVLLGMKKRGFGSERWNGFGGKVEPGESIEEAAHRELREEAGIDVSQMEKAGLLEFTFEGDPVLLEVHVFRAGGMIGEPVESDEMRPQWFAESEIPYDAMWLDDKYWLPVFLKGKKFHGVFHFENEKKLLEYAVAEA